MTRLLVVSPVFHGYSRSIAAAFERRGHEVTVHNYDARGTLHRFWHKASVELPARLGRSAHAGDPTGITARVVSAVRELRPDRVLVVKGDVLGDAFYDELDGTATRPRIGRVLWLYDELRRTRYDHDTLARYDGIASYSPADTATLTADGFDVHHVPLAYDPALDPAPGPRSIEAVFVGARYPSRERLITQLYLAGVPVRAFGRDWSGHPYDRGRTWSWRRPDVPVGRDLPRREAYAVMAAASATLNIHGDQDGFTMRTFEACGVGGVQLIDRADVAGLYEPGVELAVFADGDELVDLAQRAVADPRWAESLRVAGRARTLAEHTFDHRIRELEQLWA